MYLKKYNIRVKNIIIIHPISIIYFLFCIEGNTQRFQLREIMK